MKPASLLGVALELIEHLAQPGRLPADARTGQWFRERRFLGSKDRRFVADTAYTWLRRGHRARSRWSAWQAKRSPRLAEPLSPAADDRGTILADLLVLAAEGGLIWTLEETCAAAQSLALPALAEADIDEHFRPGLEAGPGEDWWPDDPSSRRAAMWSLPVWLADRLVLERGESEAGALALSFLDPAPLDLRVNTRRITRDAARMELSGVVAMPVELGPWSETGLRLRSRVNVRDLIARSRGSLDVADEGSQVVIEALELAPGSTVIDACAGAGGKALAMAETARRGRRPGRVLACDIAGERLDELRRRARQAGLDDAIAAVPIDAAGPLPAVLEPADLVLVDAPCSGLGTLRRSPELKRRQGPGDVAAFSATQLEILRRFASRVRPGGRIAYATCSILAAENEDVARAFSESEPGFIPWISPWALARLPAACRRGDWLVLDPWRTQTDGFFLAVWQRRLQSNHAG